MGRKRHYRPGSFYQVDDRTGFPERVENTRQQWNNLIVSERVFEPRNQQEFVRGVRDDQSVSLPRPISDSEFILPVWTSVMADLPIGGIEIPMESIHTFGIGSHVAVMLDVDMGNMFHTFVIFVGYLTNGMVGVVIQDPLPRVVSAGQQFWNFSLGEMPDPTNLPCWIVGKTPTDPSVDEVIAGIPDAVTSNHYATAGTPADPSCEGVGEHTHAH